MPRRVAPRRVANLQTLYLRRAGATPQEIRRWRPYLTAQIGAESRFIQGGAHSSEGAQDIAQFMPATAPGYGVRLGDGRIKDDIRGQVRYMLPLLRKYGVEGALRGYNAGPGAIERSKGFSETNAYVKRIFDSAGRYRGIGGNVGGGGRGGGGGGQGAGALLAALSGGADGSSLPGGGGDALALLQALQGDARGSQGSSGGVAAPAHSAAPVMPQGLQAAVSGGGPAAQPDTAALLAAIQTVGEGTPGVGGGGLNLAAMAGGGGGQPRGGGRLGKVTIAPGADRAGVKTNRQVVKFARRVAGIAGMPITIGTGTNHSQMTVSGNVSQHWTGDAADIPAAGRRLIRLGRAALIAAGMDPRKARKARGGLYNVNGRQIIFATNEGGDHYDHLHIGL